MFSPSSFHIIGDSTRLGLVSGDSTIIVNQPLLRSYDISTELPQYEIDGERGMKVVRGTLAYDITLHIRAMGEVKQVAGTPNGFRLVDSMTVRELLSAINGKIEARRVV